MLEARFDALEARRVWLRQLLAMSESFAEAERLAAATTSMVLAVKRAS